MASDPLPSFPFLNPGEFRSICSSFLNRVTRYSGDLRALGWTNVKQDYQDGSAMLIISRIIDLPQWANGEQNDEGSYLQDDIEDDDPEMLIRPSSISGTSKVEMEYHILLSPTYQVPVLHFFFKNTPYSGPNALEIVYEHLVPPAYRSDLKQVGVMGGISMTNHPISGIPVYFIHPCNTASALQTVQGKETPTAETYLPLWLGLVGNCVGLYIPKELFASLRNNSDD
ncbi:hypothetical protein D8B26_007231 [Coccidioides posadasii str. Silveira]|uniref:Ubiquitin-like-conjugating enzyme ATG10 n=2 Tax=Coccidioides posadasii TaxID=199306 RepID=E9D350_COCPS|nr:hypothetical protein CPSG_04591 [Coccidioides posadasii str. Silveira]KMM71391.1 hypothetical protein CPAG_07698 [Coccidioides posadasii RMSCC 3488]QVM12611.1 hypothetical protein D8B26_007231 [Coccidioides posadasii str. Silveira]